MNKRQRTYRDSTNIEHNDSDYQDGVDNEMERRSEEDRLNRKCEKCLTLTLCKRYGCSYEDKNVKINL